MSPYYLVALVLFLVLFAALFVRYVSFTVDRHFRDLSRAQLDPEYRQAELTRLERLLAPLLPLPEGVGTLPPPARSWFPSPLVILTALSIVLLWGSFTTPPRESRLWLYGGIGCLVLLVLLLVLSLKRRRLERLATLLRQQADLRHFAGDHLGEVADLTTLLSLTPWDDAAWGELAVAKAESGDWRPAWLAWREAEQLDAGYADYHQAAVELALVNQGWEEATISLEAWEAGGGEKIDWVRVQAYRAVIALGRGDAVEARSHLEEARRENPQVLREYLKTESVLSPLAGL
ncbi:MAG: hypothetical protein LBU79_06360 [Planctomycetota bacterium]|jgi:tetratricopeptide (TPR) repeat protein|nr:hypothetical protein [Planctomycetota bacterium]